jgi:hypothetical protein
VGLSGLALNHGVVVFQVYPIRNVKIGHHRLHYSVIADALAVQKRADAEREGGGSSYFASGLYYVFTDDLHILEAVEGLVYQ